MTIDPGQMILPAGHSVLFEAVDWRSFETGHSDQFPGLPLADAIPRFLEQSRVDGRNATLRAFRDWTREPPSQGNGDGE